MRVSGNRLKIMPNKCANQTNFILLEMWSTF